MLSSGEAGYVIDWVPWLPGYGSDRERWCEQVLIPRRTQIRGIYTFIYGSRGGTELHRTAKVGLARGFKEARYPVDDPRGRQDTKPVTQLFLPTNTNLVVRLVSIPLPVKKYHLPLATHP